jgi:hypothetical protein
MVLLMVTFYNKVIYTFEKVIISSQVSLISADDPIPYTVSTIAGKQFMFGVEIWHHNLNSNVSRFFDVNLVHATYRTGEYDLNETVTIPLEACTV